MIDTCFREERNQEFNFGHSMFGMPIRHLSGDIDLAVMHMNLEFKKKVRTGDRKLDLVNVLMKFIPMGLDEIRV